MKTILLVGLILLIWLAVAAVVAVLFGRMARLNEGVL